MTMFSVPSTVPTFQSVVLSMPLLMLLTMRATCSLGGAVSVNTGSSAPSVSLSTRKRFSRLSMP